MSARSLLPAVLLVGSAGCLGLSGEEEQAPEDEGCPAGQARLPDGACGACGDDEEIFDGACRACPAGQTAVEGRCTACDPSCVGRGCGETNACGAVCEEACAIEPWHRLFGGGQTPEAPEPFCDGLYADQQEGRPLAREAACVGWDGASGAFVVFGGERVQPQKEPLPCRPDGSCSDRRGCTHEDTWLVRVEGTDEPTASFQRVEGGLAPPGRHEAGCISAPGGVWLFGGVRAYVDEHGLGYYGAIAEDLFHFSDGAWSQPAHLLGVGNLRAAPGAWDPAASELVVVGGCRDYSVPVEQICSGDPSAGPLTCVGPDQIDAGGFPWPYAASVAWDPVEGRLLVVGGAVVWTGPIGAQTRVCPQGGEAPASTETWELLRGGPGERPWRLHRLTDRGLPGAEWAAMAGGEREILRFGGINRAPQDDDNGQQSCLWDGATWTCSSAELSAGPAARDQGAMAHGGGRYLLVGGSSEIGYSRDDYWTYTPATAR